MINYCLVEILFIGEEEAKKEVLSKFEEMANQDYTKPRKYVGLLPEFNEIEDEFSNPITYLDKNVVKYFCDVDPNLDTIPIIGRIYKVSIEIQYENMDGMRFGTAEYDYEKDELTIMDFTDWEFWGYEYKDGFYIYEGQKFASKFLLRHYFFEKANRDKKLDFILNSFE